MRQKLSPDHHPDLSNVLSQRNHPENRTSLNECPYKNCLCVHKINNSHAVKYFNFNVHLYNWGPFIRLGFLGQGNSFHSVYNSGQFFINRFKRIFVLRASKAQQRHKRLARLYHK